MCESQKVSKDNSSLFKASLLVDELKDKHRAQLEMVEYQNSAIRDVVWALSSLKVCLTESKDITNRTLNADRLQLSPSQCNSLSQFLADCRFLNLFLDSCDLLPTDTQGSFPPKEQKEGH